MREWLHTGEASWLGHSVPRQRNVPHADGNILMRNAGWNEEVPYRVLPALPKGRVPPQRWSTPPSNVWPSPPVNRTLRQAQGVIDDISPSPFPSETPRVDLSASGRMRPTSSSPLGVGFGDSLKRSKMVDTLATAAQATPSALASSRMRPNIAGCVPHSQPRVWLLNTPTVPLPIEPPSPEAAREAAVRALRRGVGIVYEREVSWHARPTLSQVFFA